MDLKMDSSPFSNFETNRWSIRHGFENGNRLWLNQDRGNVWEVSLNDIRLTSLGFVWLSTIHKPYAHIHVKPVTNHIPVVALPKEDK